MIQEFEDIDSRIDKNFQFIKIKSELFNYDSVITLSLHVVSQEINTYSDMIYTQLYDSFK